MMYKCCDCGKFTESDNKLIVCGICAGKLKQFPYKPCFSVEVKNPYTNTDLYGQVIQDE